MNLFRCVGSYVGANVYGIHRNPDVWENPDVSQPITLTKNSRLCTSYVNVELTDSQTDMSRLLSAVLGLMRWSCISTGL